MKREIYLTVAVVVLLSVAFFNRGGQTQVQDMPNMLDFRALSQMEETEEDFSTGMHFESSGIVVDSDSEVTMLLETAGEEVDMEIAPGLGVTSFTLSGLSPSTTYYLYTDDYRNLDVVTTDANGPLPSHWIPQKHTLSGSKHMQAHSLSTQSTEEIAELWEVTGIKPH